MSRLRTWKASHCAVALRCVLTLAAALVSYEWSFALITGGTGNTPISDPGWPAGAATLFNHSGRVAYWEGPPFGGGQWHAECRGDTKAFNALLEAFAKVDAKSKRLVVHDRVGTSFWLNPNDEPEKRRGAEVDWIFMVWQPANWERLRKLPADLNPTDTRDTETGPPIQIDVYTGGNISWSEVVVPEGIEVRDMRLESHGFQADDGIVLEGTVIDLANKQPIAATVRLERIAPQAKGGYEYAETGKTTADDKGHWVIKNAPPGWHRLVVEADGYAPRVIGYVKRDKGPYWQSFESGLARAAKVVGHVIDEAGKPLAEVTVQLHDVAMEDRDRYESPDGYTATTDDEGQFALEQVPLGKAAVWVRKTGYCRPGLGEPITTPADNIELRMMRAGNVLVSVHFSGKPRPAAYIVQMEPEGGAKVCMWSGSAHIDAKNQFTFPNVPPGRYVVYGHPNPSRADEKTKPLTIEVKGGETTQVDIAAK